MAEKKAFDFDFLVRITGTMWEGHLGFEQVDWDAILELFSNNNSGFEKEEVCRHIMLAQVIHLNFPEALEQSSLWNAVASINATSGVAKMSPYELEKAMLVDGASGAIGELQPAAVTPNSPIADCLKRLAWDCQYAYRGKLSWKPGESASFINWYRTVDKNGGDPAGAIMAADAKMCCWEGVFYALIQSRVLPWNALATSYREYYTGGKNGPQPTHHIFDDLVNFLAAKGRTAQDVVLSDPGFQTTAFAAGDIVMNPCTTKSLDGNTALRNSDKPDFIWHVGLICENGVGGKTKVMHLHVHEFGASNGFVDIITLEAFGSYQFIQHPQRPRIALFHMF